jgi:nucleoside-diphosphate-sugar epimerase
METLLTGGTGLVGRHLIMALQQRGDSIRALVLPGEDASWLVERGVAIYRGDVRDPNALRAPTRGVDTVFHMAAMQGVWLPIEEYYAVNVTGTENVCRAALVAGVRRIVHVSSWTIYGMARGRVLTENDPAIPWHDPYWITKAQGDLLVQSLVAEEHLPAVQMRPGTIFGAGDHLNFGRIAEKLLSNKGLILGSGRNALPLVYVTDVVQGLLLGADCPQAEGQIYNITNDQQLTQSEFLCTIAQELGAPPPRRHIPYAAAYAIAYAAERTTGLMRLKHPLVTRHGVALFGTDNRHSIEKARTELGFVPQVGIREGICLAARWYQQQQVSVAGAANSLLAGSAH